MTLQEVYEYVKAARGMTTFDAQVAFLFTLAQLWVNGSMNGDDAMTIIVRCVRVWDTMIPSPVLPEVASDNAAFNEAVRHKPSMKDAGYEFVRWGGLACPRAGGAVFREVETGKLEHWYANIRHASAGFHWRGTDWEFASGVPQPTTDTISLNRGEPL